MRRRYARLRLICILEFLIILFLIVCIVLIKSSDREKQDETSEAIEPINVQESQIVDSETNESANTQEPQTIAEKYPYADPSHAIFAKGEDDYTVDGKMCKNGTKIDFVGEVEFEFADGGIIIPLNVDYKINSFRSDYVFDAFRELSRNGYNKAVVYGDLVEDGFKKKLVPGYVIIYDE